MANLIATEYYAYSIGGSGSYNSNRCCTKSRAIALNCSVSGSYSNNLLVPLSALSRSSSGGGSSGSYYAYYYVDSSLKYYRTTSSLTRSKSDWSGASSYNYQGYIYYSTLSLALNLYNGTASSCDSTSSTYSGSSTVVVFFFTSSSGGGSSGGDSGGDSGGGDSGGGGGDGTYYIRNLSCSPSGTGSGPVTLSSSFTVPTSVPSYVCNSPIVVTGWWIDFHIRAFDKYGDERLAYPYGRIVSESGGGAGNVYSCTKRYNFPSDYTWNTLSGNPSVGDASGGITYHPA